MLANYAPPSKAKKKTVTIRDWVDIGVDDAAGKPLLRQRKLMAAGEQSFTVVVTGEPAKAGIDPDNKLIDRKPDDNLVRVDTK